jgi:hypothetical protein
MMILVKLIRPMLVKVFLQSVELVSIAPNKLAIAAVFPGIQRPDGLNRLYSNT